MFLLFDHDIVSLDSDDGGLSNSGSLNSSDLFSSDGNVNVLLDGLHLLGAFVDNSSLFEFGVDDGLLLILMNLSTLDLLVDLLLVLLVNDGDVLLVDDLLMLLMDDGHVLLVNVFLMNHWLMMLMNHVLMMLMEHVLVLLLDDLLMVLMHDLSVMFFHNSGFMVLSHDGSLSVFLNNSLNDGLLDNGLLSVGDHDWLLLSGGDNSCSGVETSS